MHAYRHALNAPLVHNVLVAYQHITLMDRNVKLAHPLVSHAFTVFIFNKNKIHLLDAKLV